MRERPLIFRRHLKVVFESELIDGNRIRTVYVAFRGRGCAFDWGSAR